MFSLEAFHQTPCRGDSIFSDARSSARNRDSGGTGLMDEIGGSVDGFVSCTESLGCESSDEISTDDGSSINHDLESNNHNRRGSESIDLIRKRARERSAKKRREVEFPPPLTSMTRRGRPRYVLRSVRRDGRLELTEVKIHRQEILCATREKGRLTLHLVDYTDDKEDETVEAKSDETRMGDNFAVKYEDEETSSCSLDGEERRLRRAATHQEETTEDEQCQRYIA